MPEGHLLLQTLRSHDQFNTTIYGLDDRYRGVKNGRRVVFVHPDDIAHLGWQDGDLVDLVSVWHDGVRAGGDRASGSWPTTSRAAAPRRYYPETNALVPLDSKAEGSNQPDVQVGHRPARAPADRRTGVVRPGRAATRPAVQPRRDRTRCARDEPTPRPSSRE